MGKNLSKFSLSLLLLPFLLSTTSCNNVKELQSEEAEWAFIVHGGASNGIKSMTPERVALYEKHLQEAVDVGVNLFKNGASALEVVEAVVVYMEDCPLFNAGKGAVMNLNGVHELDASIMDGSNLAAGAIAGVRDIKNPITTARLVKDSTKHVFLIGEGASTFSKQMGMESVENSYFTTPARAKQQERILKKLEESNPRGTVGCVAKDANGNLAAATSTGGMSGKKWGRVGDAPIIGAATYANNNTVAVSSTGHGEFWIRRVVAYDIHALMEYKGYSLDEATNDVIFNKIDKMEGCTGGGVIAVDKKGNISMKFNTDKMYRGWATSNGNEGVKVLKD
ncbi:MAG: isoaspartyl peptidase/L-asparaginase [Bacteroidales bacterium]